MPRIELCHMTIEIRKNMDLAQSSLTIWIVLDAKESHPLELFPDLLKYIFMFWIVAFRDQFVLLLTVFSRHEGPNKPLLKIRPFYFYFDRCNTWVVQAQCCCQES